MTDKIPFEDIPDSLLERLRESAELLDVYDASQDASEVIPFSDNGGSITVWNLSPVGSEHDAVIDLAPGSGEVRQGYLDHFDRRLEAAGLPRLDDPAWFPEIAVERNENLVRRVARFISAHTVHLIQR